MSILAILVGWFILAFALGPIVGRRLKAVSPPQPLPVQSEGEIPGMTANEGRVLMDGAGTHSKDDICPCGHRLGQHWPADNLARRAGAVKTCWVLGCDCRKRWRWEDVAA